MTERKQQQASCKAAPTVKVNSLALQAETKAVPSWLRASLEAAAGRTRQAEGRKQLNDISASDKTVPERNSQQALQAHKPPVTSFTMDVSASLLQQGRWRGGSQELLAGSPQQGSRSASLPVCSTLQAQPFVTTAGSCASPVSARSQVTRAAVVYTSIFVAERPEETAGQRPVPNPQARPRSTDENLGQGSSWPAKLRPPQQERFQLVDKLGAVYKLPHPRCPAATASAISQASDLSTSTGLAAAGGDPGAALPPIYIPCQLGAPAQAWSLPNTHRPRAASADIETRQDAAYFNQHPTGPHCQAGAARHSFDVESVAADWPPSPDPVGPMRHAPSHLSISRGEVLTARDSLSSPESLGQLRGRVDHLLNYRAPASLVMETEDADEDGFPDITTQRSPLCRHSCSYGMSIAEGAGKASAAAQALDGQQQQQQHTACSTSTDGDTQPNESAQTGIYGATDSSSASSSATCGQESACPTPLPAATASACSHLPTQGANTGERPPRGQLQFCGDFEGGNIGRVQALDGGAEYELMIRPDTLAPRFRLWFHFQVTNCLAGQQVVLSIVNFSKTRSLYRQQMTPVVRSRSHPTWCRLPPSNVFYYRCPKRKMAYVLSMVFTFDKQGELYEFAYSFPYSYTHLQHFLAALAGQQLPYMRRDLLCRSPQLRQVDVITIGDGATAAAAPRRKLVCLTARVHPGETPASYVMEGLLACLADSSPAAQQLRQAATWLLVPMLNPDGCFLGNYRTDAAGVDLNRLWAGPNAALEPALYHVLQLLHRYADDERFELDVFVDIHAHSTTRAGFMFCNPLLPTSASAADMERVCRLPRALDAAMPGFSLAACQWDANACKAGCARRVVGARFPSMLAYTLEISFFNSPPSGTAQISNTGLSTGAASPVAEANTQEGCCEMGRQLALSFLKIYGVDS